MFVFGILSILVAVGATSTLDYSITDNVRKLHGSNALNVLMVSVSILGDISTLLVLAVVLTIIKRTRRAGMIFLTCILIIVVSAMYIKVIVGRDIPPFIFSSSLSGWQNKIIEPESVSPMSKDLSYPSSHIAIATCLACILELKIIHKSKLLASAIWFYPSLMALSRVYIMQSYFTDVVGGFLLGLVVVVAMSKILHLEPHS
jgi:undecaprenyl-diphosphatase